MPSETLNEVQIEHVKVFSNPFLPHVRIEVKNDHEYEVKANLVSMNREQMKMFAELVTASLADSQGGD